MPIHSPETSFGRYFAFSASLACLSIASTAPMVSVGPMPNAMRAAVPHFERRDAEHDRQALAAMSGRPGQRVPAAVDPAPVELLPAGRRGHRGIPEDGAVLVADLVERRDLLGGEAAGLGEDGVDQILGQVAEKPGVERRLEAGDMLQRERDLIDGRAIHEFVPATAANLERAKARRHSFARAKR